MPRNRLSAAERAELHEILHYAYGPSGSPQEHLCQRVIIHLIYGEDAVKCLIESGIAPFQAWRAFKRAARWLQDMRWHRRPKFDEIRASRSKVVKPRFTYQNFRVNITDAQNKDLGMQTMSIFSLVEVFMEDEEFEKDYLVNYSDQNTKDWLLKLLVWALMNKREVVIKPATEEDMKTKRLFSPQAK